MYQYDSDDKHKCVYQHDSDDKDKCVYQYDSDDKKHFVAVGCLVRCMAPPTSSKPTDRFKF